MSRAIELRQVLSDPARPVTLWELANSLLLRGKVSCLLGVRLREAMAASERAYPSVVANVSWPSRFRGPAM